MEPTFDFADHQGILGARNEAVTELDGMETLYPGISTSVDEGGSRRNSIPTCQFLGAVRSDIHRYRF